MSVYDGNEENYFSELYQQFVSFQQLEFERKVETDVNIGKQLQVIRSMKHEEYINLKHSEKSEINKHTTVQTNLLIALHINPMARKNVTLIWKRKANIFRDG